MSDLCFSLRFSGKEEYFDECIEVGKDILEHHTSDEMYRYRAIQNIAFAYRGKQDMENAKKYAELLPEFYLTKNKTLEQLLEGEERHHLAQDYAEAKDAAGTIATMKKAYEFTRAIDTPANPCSTSLFFDHAQFRTAIAIASSPDIADPLDVLKNTVMAMSQFDFVRDTEEWKSILSE